MRVPDLITRRLELFAADMRAAGIHVGLAVGSAPTRCAACGEPWPCRTEQNALAAGMTAFCHICREHVPLEDLPEHLEAHGVATAAEIRAAPILIEHVTPARVALNTVRTYAGTGLWWLGDAVIGPRPAWTRPLTRTQRARFAAGCAIAELAELVIGTGQLADAHRLRFGSPERRDW